MPTFFIRYLGAPDHDRAITLHGIEPWEKGEAREMTEEFARHLGWRPEEIALGDFAEFWTGVYNAAQRVARFALERVEVPTEDQPKPRAPRGRTAAPTTTTTPEPPAQEQE